MRPGVGIEGEVWGLVGGGECELPGLGRGVWGRGGKRVLGAGPGRQKDAEVYIWCNTGVLNG